MGLSAAVLAYLHLAGVPVARADGITLFAPGDQEERLNTLELDYRGDLSGGGAAEFQLTGGQTYFLVVDGQAAGEHGAFSLVIAKKSAKGAAQLVINEIDYDQEGVPLSIGEVIKNRPRRG